MTVLTIKFVKKDKKQKQVLQSIMFIIFWNFLMAEQISLSPQVLVKMYWNWNYPVVRHFTWKLEFATNILWMIVESCTKLLSIVKTAYGINSTHENGKVEVKVNDMWGKQVLVFL